MNLQLTRIASLAASLLSLACSSAEGEGTVEVSAYGESFIEDGIPAADLSDAWEISFEKFEVSLSDVEVGSQQLGTSEPVDLSTPSAGAGQVLGELLLPEGEYTDSSFTIARIEVIGEASKDDLSKTFHWVFDAPTRYDQCETTTSVEDESLSRFQVTVHADHLFYDSLVAAEPQLMFGPLAAADLNDDGAISKEELSQTDIGAYDPGSENKADNLWAFLSAQAQTLGHVDGEGHCHAEASD